MIRKSSVQREYSRSCIRCEKTRAYNDGETTWTYCLFCLKEMQVGPFYKRLDPVGTRYEDW